MAPLCAICCDTLNKSTRRPVSCQFCSFEACVKCVKQFLLSQSVDPQCMQCKAAWDREALERALPNAFLTGEYKAHRGKVLFEREKARLPETQERAAAEVYARRKDAANADLTLQVKALEAQIAALATAYRTNQRFAVLARTFGRVPDEAAEDAADGAAGPSQPAPARGPKFVRGCPKPACRGFLDPSCKCGVCDTQCCKKCMEEVVEGEEHACDPELVATIEMLKKDTKSCPGCSVPIHRYEGCAQVWCVECHTAFDWNTGAIATGRIHNPHYYEWMRRQNGGAAPREVGDVVCGGFPGLPTLEQWMRELRQVPDDMEDAEFRAMRTAHRRAVQGPRNRVGSAVQTARMAHRFFVHLEEIVLPQHRLLPADTDTSALRVSYLLSELQEEAMKDELYRREKVASKKRAISQVLEMLTTAGGDVARSFMVGRGLPPATVDAVESLLGQWDALRQFANEALVRASKTHDHCQVPQFAANWTFGKLKKTERSRREAA